jgi:hypothetical protein
MSADVVARIPIGGGRQLTVVNWGLHVSLHDHPNAKAHSGFTIDHAAALTLAGALSAGLGAQVNTSEALLILEPLGAGATLRPHTHAEGWTLHEPQRRKLAEALTRAVGDQTSTTGAVE